MEEFTFKKFSIVVKQMHPDKIMGPNGLNPAFFQGMLSREVFQSCIKWINDLRFSATMNDTTIVLIRKKDDAESMKNL